MAINWKNRAKKLEQHLLAAEESTLAARKTAARLDFALEKEKALHRRSLGDLNVANLNLNLAITLIQGAAENLSGHGKRASADALMLVVNNLMPRDGCAIAPKDEQH